MFTNPLTGSVSPISLLNMRTLSSPRARVPEFLPLPQDVFLNDLYVGLPEMFKKYIDHATNSLGISLEFYDLITETDTIRENQMIQRIQFSKNSNLHSITFNSHGFPIETSCYELESKNNLLYKFPENIGPELTNNVKLKLWKYEGINTNLSYSGEVIATVESGIVYAYLYHGKGMEFDCHGNVIRSGNWCNGVFVEN